MALSVTCSGCQSQYSVPDNMAGKRAKCKKCGAVLVMPAAAPSGGIDLFADLESAKPASSGSSGDSLFGDLEAILNCPAPAGDLCEGGQCGPVGAEDDIIGEVLWVLAAASDQQPMVPGRLLQPSQP